MAFVPEIRPGCNAEWRNPAQQTPRSNPPLTRMCAPRGFDSAAAICQTPRSDPEKDQKTMTDITLSPDDLSMLIKALQNKSPDVVQARMANALLLLADGLSVEDVAGLLYLEERDVAGWHKMFAKRGKRAA